MYKDAISYYNGENLTDKIIRFLLKRKLIKTIGYYPITDNETKETMMYFLVVEGNKFLVKLLSFITEYRGKDKTLVKIDIPD